MLRTGWRIVMRWFNDLGIRTKIIASFSAISILAFLAYYPGIQDTLRTVCACCVVLLGPALGLLVSTSIRRPLSAVACAAQKAAAGEDLDDRIPVETEDEIGILAASLSKILQDRKKLAFVATRISQG